MNILVYDVAADNGGATTILEHYYNTHINDFNNHYYYLLSTYKLDDTENSTILNFPLIKKSWINRIVFDCVKSKKILKKYNIDQVFSLQNTILPSFKGYQTVYVHNVLPFSEYRFSFKEFKMWVYQNIIGRLIVRSIKKADKVIVQTHWMKNAIREKCNIKDKVDVQFPDVEIPKGFSYKKQDKAFFFYPANGAPFKNHKVILEACKILKKANITNYEVIFTLNGNENEGIARIKNEAEENDINIRWIGTIPREEVFKWYERSILIFPSYIETIGLPIYEAMQVGSPIIVTNCEYAQSLTKDYKKAFRFNYDDVFDLEKIMIHFCDF